MNLNIVKAQIVILILHKIELKELKAVKQIKLEEDHQCIMAQGTFVLCGVIMSGLMYLLTEPKHLIEENAWVKDYDYNGYRNLPDVHYFVNKVTRERRPLTKQQFDDDNYTLNT